MTYAAPEQSSWSRTGQLSRVIIGVIFVLLTGYVGVIWISPTAFSPFWPYAGLWAAIGWGGSRLSLVSVFALVLIGLIMDVMTGGPVGCWPAILLTGFLIASIFRKRAQTDRSGMIRGVGDLAAFVAAFLFARWLMGAYLGGIESRDIIGGFLSAAILYFPFRPLFRLSSDNRVDR